MKKKEGVGGGGVTLNSFGEHTGPGGRFHGSIPGFVVKVAPFPIC